MKSYKLVLQGEGQGSERTGYVFCISDEQASAAASALLKFHPDQSEVYAYDENRLVCWIQRGDLGLELAG